MAGFDKKITIAPGGKLAALVERFMGAPIGKVVVDISSPPTETIHPGGTDPFISLVEDPPIEVDGETFYEYEVRTNILRLNEMGMDPAQMRETIGPKIWDFLVAKDEAAAKAREEESKK